MKRGEIEDISLMHPFMGVVLGMIDQGESITQGSPFYDTYLMARQRGFVERTGPDKKNNCSIRKR